MHELIEEEKSKIIKNNGLTKEENNFVREYYEKNSLFVYGQGEAPTKEEKQRYIELNNKKIVFSGKKFDRYPPEKKERLIRAEKLKQKIVEKYKELNEIQTIYFTDEYVETFSNWISELNSIAASIPEENLNYRVDENTPQ